MDAVKELEARVNMNALRAALDEIMVYFNFEKVHRVMEALDWRWYFKDYVSHVPTVDEIKKAAEDLLWQCCLDPDNNVHSTGGLEVEKEFSDPEDPWIALRFIVADWDASGKMALAEHAEQVDDKEEFDCYAYKNSLKLKP